jgi:hypothetical protein
LWNFFDEALARHPHQVFCPICTLITFFIILYPLSCKRGFSLYYLHAVFLFFIFLCGLEVFTRFFSSLLFLCGFSLLYRFRAVFKFLCWLGISCGVLMKIFSVNSPLLSVAKAHFIISLSQRINQENGLFITLEHYGVVLCLRFACLVRNCSAIQDPHVCWKGLKKCWMGNKKNFQHLEEKIESSRF